MPSEMLSAMRALDREWSLSNPGPGELLVWLEPWAEEFEVSARSTITLSMASETEVFTLGAVEWTAEHLVFWAGERGTVRVYIDGVQQDSASALVPVPEGLSKRMLNVVFADQPTARLGGQRMSEVERTSWRQHTRRWLGLS